MQSDTRQGTDARSETSPSICPERVTHTSPGQRPGNPVRENRCVLKEHRIGREPGSRSEAPGYAAFLQNAGVFCRVFPRFAPWAGSDAPLGHSDGNVVPIRCNGAALTRWNTMPGWGEDAGSKSHRAIGPNGAARTCWDAMRRLGRGHWIEIPSCHWPQWGRAAMFGDAMPRLWDESETPTFFRIDRRMGGCHPCVH